jgi:hypothetical protein
MNTAETAPASAKPELRWYQFTLRTLLGIMLHVAICCSILATGISWREHRAVLLVQPDRPCFTLYPTDAELQVKASVVRGHVAYEIACTEAVAAHAAQQLRQKGIVWLDGEETSLDAVTKRLTINDYGIIQITARSRDPDDSRQLVMAFYDAWIATIPETAPSLAPRFLELVRQGLSKSEWQEFETDYRGGGYSLILSGPFRSYSLHIVQGPNVTVVRPYKTIAIWTAIAWGALGVLTIVCARLRRVRGMVARIRLSLAHLLLRPPRPS